ncbi:addiction module antidote protein, HigA family [Xenococcus sp. PCC 7305]|nr:HigA family addiction module antitoxin [Xenococcus sp. PCC 7305]ELS02778.1 addiction module antidote protein, HigA family [Xenococcus sp. PCC 7305]
MESAPTEKPTIFRTERELAIVKVSTASESIRSSEFVLSGLKMIQLMLKLLIITKISIMNRPINRMRPVHPGEILREDFLSPMNMSVNALALALNVPATRIHEIVKERRSITADTAERLARYFGGDAVSWLNLQAIYDLKTLTTRDEIMRRVEPRTKESIA